MNISQHVFMPLSQKRPELGYYNQSGVLVTTGSTAQNYRSYPILEYPTTDLVTRFLTLNNYSGTKLRTWSTVPPTSQSTKAFNVEYNSVSSLVDDMLSYTSADYKDDYWIRLLFWKQ